MNNPLQTVTTVYDAAYSSYKAGKCQAITAGAVGAAALTLLHPLQKIQHGAIGHGAAAKHYDVFQVGNVKSRPICRALFISDPANFTHTWASVISKIDSKTQTLIHPDTDAALYTCLMAFAATYDIYRRASRKTPGTFLELMMGSILEALTGLARGTQIDIPNSTHKVTTDVFFRGLAGAPSLVAPTKISTRERIVQAYAHQRILDDIFGRGVYKSVLIASNEMQLDEKNLSVNEICVPGQVLLFQKHLADLYGIYYLDPPTTYTSPQFTAQVPVAPVSKLLATDLPMLLV